MELNFKEDLVKFDSIHAKLLFMIYHFYKHKKLTKKQKYILKSRIISDDDAVFYIFEEFEKTLNDKKLLKEFLEIYHAEFQSETPRKRNNNDYSFSYRGNLTKNLCELSRKHLGSKLSFVKDRSYVNKTTVPLDSNIKERIAKLDEFKVDVCCLK